MKNKIENILNDLKAGGITPEEAREKLYGLMYEDLGYAKVDHLRKERKGIAEVIYCASKTPLQVAGIVFAMKEKGEKNVLLTRANKEVFEEVKKIDKTADYNKTAGTIVCFYEYSEPEGGMILIACAGTSDLPVAEEAYVTAKVMGNRVEKLYDVGIAGLHRLLMNAEKVREANVIVAAAGMEGALPGVIAALTDKPVIAVPTSVGYGANLNGISALLSMLNSCSSGLSVVNIDNGFGAGYQAALINNLSKRQK